MGEIVDDARVQDGVRSGGQGGLPGSAGGDGPGTARGRRVAWWAGLLLGAGSALLGLLPWLARGGRLPLQNLWEGGIPAEAPIVLLPFSQYAVTSIFALLVAGGTFAGVAAQALAARGGGRASVAWVGLGLLVVQVVAVVQTVVVVRGGLRPGDDSLTYLRGIAAGTVACAVVSLGAFALIALAPRAGALFGLTTGAIAAASWIPIVFAGPLGTSSMPLWLFHSFAYVTPVLAGAAIAWAGVRTAGRVVSALVALALVWVAPAVTTAVAAALGTRILARDLPGMLEYGEGVFRMYVVDPTLALQPLAVAVVVAVIGLVGREVFARRAAVEAGARAGSDAAA